ncbi:glutathione gamma-glutamylcysteinyltransferase 2-like isoform X2 [Anneissia japonica]|uniref:glutathione gamma-glutamylcysteinyltransferase 2-like isoform X2 n=1 Tax=Anneissia japonica TaxID=1529436 RepID=UPI001425AEC2|nr:glutathione gamma-glutamylcysteinyltransferase 2-like isoform X2 [Anneissia japonica]
MAQVMMSEVIPLHSSEGQRLRTETSQKALHYQPILYKIFQKQFNSTYCGLVSSIMAMNANFIGQHGHFQDGSPHVPFTEANIFTFKETQNILKQSEVEKEGCTLEQVHDLIRAHGYNSVLYHAADSSLEEFCAKAKCALNQNSLTSVIINYDLKVIYPHQNVGGHFSPLCAYHEESDRFLILDTWPKTEECWVKSDHLFNSMNTVDPSVSKTRGYIIVSK